MHTTVSTSNPSSDPHRDTQASGAPADETTGGAPARRRRRATAAATTPTRVPAAEQPVLAAPDGSRGDGGDEDPSRAVRPEDGDAEATEPAQEDVVEDARTDEAADVDADGARADDAEGAADAGADEAPRDGAAQAGGPGTQAPYLPAASLLFPAPDPARARRRRRATAAATAPAQAPAAEQPAAARGQGPDSGAQADDGTAAPSRSTGRRRRRATAAQAAPEHVETPAGDSEEAPEPDSREGADDGFRSDERDGAGRRKRRRGGRGRRSRSRTEAQQDDRSAPEADSAGSQACGTEGSAEAAEAAEAAVPWSMPYLPIDPHDVGRSYEAVVRVNSQSGKGGVAYLLKQVHNLDLPRRLQIEFSRIVQRHADTYGGEVDARSMWSIFTDEYLPAAAAPDAELPAWGRFSLKGATLTAASEGEAILTVTIADGPERRLLTASGNGPLDAFVAALEQTGVRVRILDYVEHALSEGRDARAASYVECEVDGQVLWGVGIDPSITTSSFKAVISAVNRALR